MCWCWAWVRKQRQAVAGAEPGILHGEGEVAAKEPRGLQKRSELQHTATVLNRWLPKDKKLKSNIDVNQILLSMSCFTHFCKRDPCKGYFWGLLMFSKVLWSALCNSVSILRSSDIAHHFTSTAIETVQFQNTSLQHGRGFSMLNPRAYYSTVCARELGVIDLSVNPFLHPDMPGLMGQRLRLLGFFCIFSWTAMLVKGTAARVDFYTFLHRNNVSVLDCGLNQQRK